MEVDAVGGADIFVTEPEGDGGGVDAVAQEVHGAAYLLSILKSAWSQGVLRVEAGEAREARAEVDQEQLWKRDPSSMRSVAWAPCRVGCGLPGWSLDKVRILVRHVPDGARNACPSHG